MDYGIGEIFKTLKNQKLDKNTVVLFFSDNGAQEKWVPTTQYDGKYGPNYNLGSNLPLRDFKTSNYEGAIRVPAIISWPQYLEAGTSKNYLSVIDFMPTFLKWANTENIPNSVEGQNVSDLLSSENKNRNSPIYIRGHLQESVIVKPFKLIRTRHLNSKTEFELYNIEEDPSEEKNLTEKNQEEVAKLLVLLKKEFAKDIDKVNVGLKD